MKDQIEHVIDGLVEGEASSSEMIKYRQWVAAKGHLVANAMSVLKAYKDEERISGTTILGLAKQMGFDSDETFDLQQMGETSAAVEEGKGDRRFRASIYVDIFVPESDDLEADRAVAEMQAKEYADVIPNAFVGGVAHYTPAGVSGSPLDREL